MLNLKEIKTLEKIRTKTPNILSLYLNCDQKELKPEEIRIGLKDLLKEVENKIEKRHKKRIQDYIKLRLKSNTKSLVFFCSPDFFKVYELSVSVPNQVILDTTPYTRPLTKILDEYERYCVIVVDKEKARVFTVYLGEIEEYKDIISYPKFPGKHDMGGWAQKRMQRHIDLHVKRHLKQVAKQTYSFFRKNNFDRLIVAGSKEILPDLEKILHPYLKQRLSGKFLTETWRPQNHFLKQSQVIEEKVEREKEKQLVAKLKEYIGKDRGVVGLGKVIYAAQKKKLQNLIISFGFVRPGKQCLRCGFISIIPQLKKCPYCKVNMEEVKDVIERLQELALEQGAKVEFVKDNKWLEKMGNVGAILRFK